MRVTDVYKSKDFHVIRFNQLFSVFSYIMLHSAIKIADKTHAYQCICFTYDASVYWLYWCAVRWFYVCCKYFEVEFFLNFKAGNRVSIILSIVERKINT